MQQNPNLSPMDDINQSDLKNLKISLFLSLLFIITFIISPSSSSSSSTNHQTGVPDQEDENTGEKSRYRLVYIKKTTPFVMNRPQHDRQDHHHEQHHHHHHHHGNGNHRRMRYFKMIKKREMAVGHKNRPNQRVRPAAFSVMLPKGFVPPSGSSPCHNQNPNSASTSSFCDLSVSRNP